MKKIFLLIVLLFTVTNFWSQRNQIIAYIDMEYILENVPEYIQAQNILDAKTTKWKNNLDKETRYIEVLKSDLANEKAILTKDLIEEKEEEIALKQIELRRLESLYFGPNGDLFLVRKQLVKPIQDQVYNAIQNIAKRKSYDFVFEKSSDLIMLYSNKKYDISDLVLSTIDRTRLSNQKKEERNKRANAPKRELTENQKAIIATKEAKIEEAKKKKEEAAAEKLAANEAKKKAIAEKRAALAKKREEQREILRKKKEALKKKKEELEKEEQNKEDN